MCEEDRVTFDTVIQEVLTRWNSMYNMLERYLQQCDLIQDYFNKMNNPSYLLSADQIKHLRVLMDIFKPIAMLTI